MGLFRKTPEEIEEKRKKNFDKQERKFRELLANNPDVEKADYNRVISTAMYTPQMGVTNDFFDLPRTRDEYIKCAELFEKWCEYIFYYFDNRDTTTLSTWELSKYKIIKGIYFFIVLGKYKQAVDYTDEFFSRVEKITSFNIRRVNIGEKKVQQKAQISMADMFSTIAAYGGFAAYRDEDYKKALELFDINPNGIYRFKFNDNDVAKARFSNFNNEINVPYLIEQAKSKS
jgi:hypothetical protein